MEHLSHPIPRTVQLARRELLRIADGTTQVACDRGSVWLTLDRDPRDILLGPGERFRPPVDRGMIAYALAPSTLTLAA